ncbi:MAG TPA: isochorismate synthase [Bacillus sp. (in: firmicutes)]|uniref:isochorismate synthase n=1 Tax=Bacillus litorisediminis TaxID=2922713 RepID=UPI001FAF8406|nr:isochorismate synthase [Bacillus litorisediminis]HWO75679.1 isochorismate synthase [Bacillus sp. (in: firmicutes)]
MAVAQPALFAAKALEAIQMAKQKNEPFFVSEILKLDYINPFHFYRAGQALYQSERFFWKNADDTLQLVGVGSAFSIYSHADHGRFAHVEEEWTKFKGRVVSDNKGKIEGTGPVLLGGFSFDPKKRDAGIWSAFPNAQFFVPKFLLTIHNQKHVYLSVTFPCKPNDEESIVNGINQELDFILSHARKSFKRTKPVLVSKEEIAPEQWKETVASAIQTLKNKVLEKVVLARKLVLTFEQPLDVTSVLQTLDQEQKDSFVFSFDWEDASFVGATPERLVRKRGDVAQSTCLAGSIGVGQTEEETAKLAEWLLQDKKNSVEHNYVVQQITKTFENLCLEVDVDEKPKVLKMRDIQHLYTGVRGKVLHHVSLLDFVESLHPTPALGGTPRNKALQLIRDLEVMDRGFYAAPIGWCDFEDNGEFVVGLRSALVQGDKATLFAGCGVVESSVPEKEYEETAIKFKPMLSALGGMEN